MARLIRAPGEKPLFWVGSSKEDLLKFPSGVQDVMGTALSVAQFGGKHAEAKPWKGEGPGVFEIVGDHRGNTFRAVYTVRFERAMYVLHAFQKKSPRSIRTSRKDIGLIRQRLSQARRDYEAKYGESKK